MGKPRSFVAVVFIELCHSSDWILLKSGPFYSRWEAKLKTVVRPLQVVRRLYLHTSIFFHHCLPSGISL